MVFDEYASEFQVPGAWNLDCRLETETPNP